MNRRHGARPACDGHAGHDPEATRGLVAMLGEATAIRGPDKPGIVAAGVESLTTRWLVAGASPDGTPDGEHPILTTIRNDWMGAARRLLKAGASADAADGDGGALHGIIKATAPPWALVRMLHAAGAAWDTRDRHGATALDHAIAAGDVVAVRACIAEGCPVDMRDADGRTPLLRACRWHEPYDDDGWILPDGHEGSSVLPVRPDPAVIGALLAAGADPDARDGDGRTALWNLLEDGRQHGQEQDGVAAIRVVLAGGGDPGGMGATAAPDALPGLVKLFRRCGVRGAIAAWIIGEGTDAAPMQDATASDRAWAAAIAAKHAEAPWSMRLLASCGRRS